MANAATERPPIPAKDLPPPPPRRTVSERPPAPVSPSRTSIWARARASTTAAWDSAYKLSDKVGGWSNQQAAKLGTEAFYPTSLEIESAKAARILRTFTMDASDLPEEPLMDAKKTQKVLKKIPPSALEHAQGLAIFTVLRTGFLVSGSGGSGIVLARLNDGSWSAPSGILLHTVGFGFLAGVDVYDIVLILRTQAAVQSFTHPRFSLGGEINVTAGPVGAGAMLETSIDSKPSPVWSYSKSKGAYAGLQLDGQILIERNDENERSYGREIKAEQIFAGEVSPPYWCEGLHNTILAASGKAYDASAIPLGASPSDLPSTSPHTSLPTSSSSSSIASSSHSSSARRLPPQDLDDEDLAARREMEAALRDFGIEDPAVNTIARREDPDMVVERRDPEEEVNTGEDMEQAEAEAGQGILSEVVEAPPEEERRRSLGPPPPVPPRRTPRLGSEEHKEDVEARAADTTKDADAEGKGEEGQSEAEGEMKPAGETQQNGEGKEESDDQQDQTRAEHHNEHH